MSDPQRPGPIAGLPMIGIHVTDTDEALGFYRDLLGLEVVADRAMPELGGRLVILDVPGSSTVLALFPASEREAAGTNTGIRLAVEDPEAWHAFLSARGVRVEELLRWPGIPPMFVFSDADGNGLVVVGEQRHG